MCTNNDIKETIDLINGKTTTYMESTYRNTNELLGTYLPNYDFTGKEVLSVLASSDHVFSAYYMGAKCVDSFDANKLCYYYFYLRKWLIMKYKIASIPRNNYLIKLALSMADLDKELDPYLFWCDVLNSINIPLYKSGMFLRFKKQFDLPYTADMKRMAELIKDKDANFSQFNIFDSLDVTKQYDIILLSNIYEYAIDYEDRDLMIRFRDNLRRLIKKDGVIVNSCLEYVPYEWDKDFSEYFSYGTSCRDEYQNTISYSLRLK